MASYFSALLTTTTSRVATLRQNLLPTENDGDTLDDTHLCRVLRAYYTEKGRNLPGWLPPDPKAPVPVVQQPVYTSNVGATYGGGIQGQPGMGAQGRGSALSSLWDAQPPQQQGGPPTGLRATRPNPFQKPQPSPGPEIRARPLPSQREGSYQQAGAFGGTPPGSSGSGMTAADRLKSRMKGARSTSPANDGRSAPPSNNSYGSPQGASQGGGGNYEDRFMPPDNGYGGGRSEKPFMAATSPWASNEAEFGGGGYNPPAPQGGRQGLPGGPAAGRRGLPSGPRGYR